MDITPLHPSVSTRQDTKTEHKDKEANKPRGR